MVRSIRAGAARMGSAGITRVLGRRRHPVVTRPPVLGVVRHAGLRAIRRAVGTPERRAHDRATFRKPLPNRCFCECRRQPRRRLAHATTPPRTVNAQARDFSSRDSRGPEGARGRREAHLPRSGRWRHRRRQHRLQRVDSPCTRRQLTRLRQHGFASRIVRRKQLGQAPGDSPGNTRHDLGPVSYTHLTLPTNREV